jgi:hypothetical protein
MSPSLITHLSRTTFSSRRHFLTTRSRSEYVVTHAVNVAIRFRNDKSERLATLVVDTPSKYAYKRSSAAVILFISSRICAADLGASSEWVTKWYKMGPMRDAAAIRPMTAEPMESGSMMRCLQQVPV